MVDDGTETASWAAYKDGAVVAQGTVDGTTQLDDTTGAPAERSSTWMSLAEPTRYCSIPGKTAATSAWNISIRKTSEAAAERREAGPRSPHANDHLPLQSSGP